MRTGVVRRTFGWLVATGLAAAVTTVIAQVPPPPPPGPAALPAEARRAGLEQKLGAQVPLDAVFRDEAGAAVRIGDLIGDRPAILSIVYYRCPMLCTLVLNGLVRAMRPLSLSAGGDFDVLTISIDPQETPELAAAKKKEYLAQYGRDGAEAGWRFLTGDKETIDRVTGAVGFSYSYDEATGEYAHASGIMVLTPEGRVHRYLYGIEYAPRDLRLGLVDAGSGSIGSPVDQVLLLCYRYDPVSGTYGFAIMTAVRVAGILVLAALALYVTLMIRRERAQARAAGGP
jgi:protein SCO1/2